MKILIDSITNPVLENQIRGIAQSHPEKKVEIIFSPTRNDLLREVVNAEILVPTLEPEVFLKAEKLEWVHCFYAGVDTILFPEFLTSDVVLTCAKGIVGVPLAEHAFGLLLALTRGIAQAARRRTWGDYPYQAVDLYGKVMGILGFGGTGREIAARAHAFGMKILAMDIHDVPKPDYVKEIWNLDQIPRLLQESDVVMVGLPLTERTRGILNGPAFRQMKSTAFLINVTRGKIMEMPALIEALEKGWIAGAGLDVVPEEPLPPDNPLWKMENVILTPHVAIVSTRSAERNWNLFLENLQRWLDGRPLLGVFDRNQGF